MSTPSMNHNSHIHQRQEQQQQQQQINETQHAHSNSANSLLATLTRSDSTSTVILEEEETRTCRRNGPPTLPASLRASLSTQLRSLLKTSGLFSNDLESSDKLNELFADGNEFTLQRLLSEIGSNDLNFDINELTKMDSNKLIDCRTLSEFLRSESFDQLLASSVLANNQDTVLNSSAMPCSTTSFSELRPVSPELITNSIFNNESDASKMQADNALSYNQMNSLSAPTSTVDTSVQFDHNQGALNAFEHDHAFLTKRTPVSTVSKRATTRRSRRTSSRIQAHAVLSTPIESTSQKNKNHRQVNRATDIETSDDLSYYLERRRKNNEASKASRAARKQKFGDMNVQCEEYERVNNELHRKIAVLEKVTVSLKSGLVNNFQRKPGV